MTDFEAAAEEYRVAYQQLQHAEKDAERVMEAIERDHALAAKRYEVARERFLRLALGEMDEFVKSDEE